MQKPDLKLFYVDGLKEQPIFAVTNARFTAFHGLPVVPYAFSTTPVPLRKSARSSRAQ
jgi:hypothetical protein